MSVQSLITHDLPNLSLTDSGQKALRLMNEYRVFHLPLVQQDNYLALISEDDILDWDTPEEPLSLAEFINFRPAVFSNMHPFEAMKVVKENNLSVVPVLNAQNHYEGVVTSEGLFSYFADTNGIKELGGIIVLEMEPRNYSLSEISRICESNDVSILSLFIKSKDESGLQLVTLKTNRKDIQSLISTFERYNYTIAEIYSVENSVNNLQQNYDALMHFINI
jgi:predicted transcriptional regulator